MEHLADGLYVPVVFVEILLDGENHILVDYLRCSQPCKSMHDGGEVLGSDLHHVGIILYRTVLFVLVIQKEDEFIEHSVLPTAFLRIGDNVLTAYNGE